MATINVGEESFWERWRKFGSRGYPLSQSKSDRGYFLTVFPPNYFDYFIDIGAHLGWVSSQVAERNPLTKILSFEPASGEYEFMVENTKKYHNIQTFKLALGNGKPLNFKGKKSEQDMFIEEDTGKYAVQSKTLYDIFKQNNIDPNVKRVFLKIDCEGGERFLLNDPQSINIMKSCIHIGIEIHYTAPCVTNEIFHYCKLPSYETYVNWVKGTFSETHELLYHKSRKTIGIGTYTLTRKDVILSKS